MDAVTQYAWILWLALILIFVIVEMITLEFTFLMLAVGSVGGLLTGLVGAPFWVQVPFAAVLAALLLFTVRPSLLRLLKRGGDPTPSGSDALLGLAGSVVIAGSGPGQVKLANGETWTARLSPLVEDRPLGVGERVVVTAIDGATAVVVPAERSSS
ncbi:Membrane protein implicated in regulation of membrane protease activity [Rathayibacter oskolensis]|uniref:Membrane protein implicated in regulation of membrane protease activity n=1 Tax=Rathayibacter oskolensis TaxID=1891671 RepID=A0A1X7NKK4_9MICO|nr:NfeD family protein [Rathayibacter oskolensis]SMH38389.1 Membrane protein implicated in regulation of membrane protease activity [Rathayibacter oskolensis]